MAGEKEIKGSDKINICLYQMCWMKKEVKCNTKVTAWCVNGDQK